MNPLSYKIHTFGCKVNTYDTGLLQKRLSASGYTESQEPRVHVLNTCAVTGEATKEAVRLARRLKSKDPFCRVVVTGCAAQVDTEKFAVLPGVDLVVANSHKGQLEDLIRGLYNGKTEQKVYKSNIFRKEDLEAGGGTETDHTRAFLKIQDGCNSFCSFCVIPFARGKSRSIPVSELVKRVRQLEGVGEVVLTGVHIGDYEDGEKRLEDLIESILLFTKVPRIRLTSLEPIEISDRLLELYSDPRLCRHFHMSIQSANTKVLGEMKRKYSAQEVETSLQRIAKSVPEAFVGMDVIAGFPGETEEEFQDTYDRLESLPWTRLHVFPYSLRPGTKAARIEGHLDRAIVKERSRRLNQLSRERLMASASAQIGQKKLVLGLKGNADNHLKSQTIRSLSRDYWSVQLTRPISWGEEVGVKVIGHVGFEANEGSPYLTAEPL